LTAAVLFFFSSNRSPRLSENLSDSWKKKTNWNKSKKERKKAWVAVVPAALNDNNFRPSVHPEEEGLLISWWGLSRSGVQTNFAKNPAFGPEYRVAGWPKLKT
jgi:hypothetical protein